MSILKLVISAVLVLSALSALAQDSRPAQILRQIQQEQTQKVNEARAAGKTANLAELQAEARAKAVEATKDVDPATVPASEAYDWARLFSMAGRHHETCVLAERFLATNPEPTIKFQAQILMLQSCNEMGEGARILEVLPQVKAPNPALGSQLASLTVGRYVDTIAQAKGVDAAIRVLDEVERDIPVESPDVIARRNFEAEVARRKSQGEPDYSAEEAAKRLEFFMANARNAGPAMKFSFAAKKAALLAQDKRTEEAAKVLDSFAATLPDGSPYRGRAISEKNKITLPGKAAPEFAVDRTIGEYKSLDAYRGKVVLLKFFAHW
ncbi:MAG TPA: hypothetical protein VM328_10160 [Fimbriimonadaceae bacterium]|nr:hypothetical protein [Fimbriimonadaceae bacterium]